MASRSGTDQHRSLTSSHSCRVKELVSIHGLLTFFFFLCFLPAECSQNGLKPRVAAKTRKRWFSCRGLWSYEAFPSINRVPLHDANQRHRTMQFTVLLGCGGEDAVEKFFRLRPGRFGMRE